MGGQMQRVTFPCRADQVQEIDTVAVVFTVRRQDVFNAAVLAFTHFDLMDQGRFIDESQRSMRNWVGESAGTA